MSRTLWMTAGAAAAVASAAANAQGLPRTPWGDPDLQGTYTSDNSAEERAADAAER